MPQRRRPRNGNFSAQTSASLHPSAALPPAASAGCPYQQLRHGVPASCFCRLPVPAAPPRHPGQLLSPAAFAGCPYQQLRYSAPASNKPHSAEKSTPVWLAIWRIWAGFANSQLLSAAFRSIYLYIDGPIPLAATLGCCSNRRKSVGPSAPIAYATSVSPPDEAAAWPGRRCWV